MKHVQPPLVSHLRSVLGELERLGVPRDEAADAIVALAERGQRSRKLAEGSTSPKIIDFPGGPERQG